MHGGEVTTDEEMDAAADRIATRFGGNVEGHAVDLVRLAADQGTNAADALAGLRLIALANRELRQIEVALMNIARDSGMTWQQIAEALGLSSRQSAESRYRALSGRRPPKAGEAYTTLEDLVREITTEAGADPVAVLDEANAVAAALGIRVERDLPTPLTATQARQIEGQIASTILKRRPGGSDQRAHQDVNSNTQKEQHHDSRTAEVQRGGDVMTPEAGDWVAEHVLTRQVVTSAGGLDMLRRCPCRYGPSGHCAAGDHVDCPLLRDPQWYSRPQPEACMVDSHGGVVAVVWTGQGCRWRCECDCGHRAPDPWGAPESFAGIEQPSLFAFAEVKS